MSSILDSALLYYSLIITGLSALILWFGTFVTASSPYSEKKETYIFGFFFILEYIVLPAGSYYALYYMSNEKFHLDALVIKYDFILFALSAIIAFTFIKKNYTKIENFGKCIVHFKKIEEDNKIKSPPKSLKRYVYISIFILVTVIAGTLCSETSGNLRYYGFTSAILITTFVVSSLSAILYGLDLTSFEYVNVKMQNSPYKKSGIVLKDGDYMRLITENGSLKINKDIISIVDISGDKYRYDANSEDDSLRNNLNCVE